MLNESSGGNAAFSLSTIEDLLRKNSQGTLAGKCVIEVFPNKNWGFFKFFLSRCYIFLRFSFNYPLFGRDFKRFCSKSDIYVGTQIERQNFINLKIFLRVFID